MVVSSFAPCCLSCFKCVCSYSHSHLVFIAAAIQFYPSYSHNCYVGNLFCDVSGNPDCHLLFQLLELTVYAFYCSLVVTRSILGVLSTLAKYVRVSETTIQEYIYLIVMSPLKATMASLL